MPQIPAGWTDLMYDPNWRCWIAKKNDDVAANGGNFWAAPEFLLFESHDDFLASRIGDMWAYPAEDGTVAVFVADYLKASGGGYPADKSAYVRAPHVQSRGNTVESLARLGWDPLASLVLPEDDPRNDEAPNGRVDAEPPDVSAYQQGEVVSQSIDELEDTMSTAGVQGVVFHTGPTPDTQLALIVKQNAEILNLLRQIAGQ